MKQKLIDADEVDCLSAARKRGFIVKRAGVWKKVKRAMNKRFRKQRGGLSNAG